MSEEQFDGSQSISRFRNYEATACTRRAVNVMTHMHTGLNAGKMTTMKTHKHECDKEEKERRKMA